MLNFKKNTQDKEQANLEKDLYKEMDKEMSIHTMPEKFRTDSAKAESAKTTGIIVMALGLVFILLISAGIYFFLLKTPKKEPAVNPENEKISEMDNIGNENEENIATTTANLGLIENEPATSTEEMTPVASSSSESFVSDMDQDGLSAQEELLLGTDDNNTDSDGDGYSDNSEFANWYDPAGPGKLTDNKNLTTFQNNTFGYSLIYPANWIKSEIGGEDSILFRTEASDFVQMIVQPNADKISIEDWYKDQFGVEQIDSSQFINIDSWQGVKSTDGLTTYLTGPSREYIYVLSHNAQGNEAQIHKNIFDLMIKSLRLNEQYGG